MSEKEKNKKLEESVFFIDATSEEQFWLWKENNADNFWEQDHMGFMQCIGFITKTEDYPIWVSFSFAHIWGKRICFYYTSGRYNDSVKVEKFIEKNYPVKWDGGTRRAMTNATNFHHAIDRCRNEDRV